MDDDGLNISNWGYYDPPVRIPLGLQLKSSSMADREIRDIKPLFSELGTGIMSSMADDREIRDIKPLFSELGTGVISSMEDREIRDIKPLFSELGTGVMSSMEDREIHDIKPLFSELGTGVMSAPNVILHHRDYMFSGPPHHVDYVKDTWINHRDKFLHVFPENPYNALLAEASASHHMQMSQQPEQPGAQKETGHGKRRSGADAKPPKTKKPKKNSSIISKENGKTKIAKRSIEVVINGIDMDIAGIPTPVCSCTGTPQQCYRWGCGGWQSACCTTTISMYPLPMNTKRRGARIAGRKMSLGAFKKVLEKLSAEGYNFDNSIDLRTHWAKHGTNKFVTIR